MCGTQHTIVVSPDNERPVTECAVIRESRGCSLQACKIIGGTSEPRKFPQYREATITAREFEPG
jgi:hypothetical protein